jgi:NDP-sugar pyrophosphorylase family protein
LRVFVLAGGLGTRLRARFGTLPKPLAPLGGRPFLERQLGWLGEHRLAEVVLCVGHGAEQVESALGDGSALGMRLAYSRESEPLGTGGALRNAARFVDGPALVLNGDTLPELDPWALERARWERGRIGAVALYRAADAAAAGRVELGEDDRVTRFVEKDPAHRGAAWVSGGCYAFDPRLWDRLPEGPSSLERDTLPGLAAEGELHGHRAEGAFWDIGTPEGWERAQRRFAE